MIYKKIEKFFDKYFEIKMFPIVIKILKSVPEGHKILIS
ncbi:Uncharacterised protein [Clostridium disporicum]|uniref:Uncharacterized protein n=1 Tax=Clostridium disporicum TaxID=84024 RepID=A0A174ENF6_9CLOT|nr:Uncharacterised protein [Clostridium disporicum]